MKYKFIVIPILVFLFLCVYVKRSGGISALLGRKHLPDVIILGPQKAGTFQLLRMIDLHSDIKVTSRSSEDQSAHEVHFFDNEENWNQGLGWYMSKMPRAGPDQLTVDFTPRYLFSDEAPSRAHQVLPHAKLILVVRDPVERLISDFAHFNETHVNMIQDNIEQFIASEHNKETLLPGYYADHIRKWLEYYPREQLHILDARDLMANPAHELQKIERFLGVGNQITDDNFVFDNNKHFYCLRQKHRPEKCHYHNKNNDHVVKKSERLTSELRQQIIDHYKPKVEDLFELAGKRFDWKHFQ